MMPIGFFFNYNDEIIQLPVNPDKISVTEKGNNKTVEVIQLGEISILKDRKLQGITFKSFFPEDSWFPAVQTRGDFKSSEFYKDFIERIYFEKKPFRLVVTGINITMQVSIESFNYYHQGGDHEDMYYDIELKEWRDYDIVEIPFDPSLKTVVSTFVAPDITTPASTTPSTSTKTETKPATPFTPTETPPVFVYPNSKPAGTSWSKYGTVVQVHPTVGSYVIASGAVYNDSKGKKFNKNVSGLRAKVNFIASSKDNYPFFVSSDKGPVGYLNEKSLVITK